MSPLRTAFVSFFVLIALAATFAPDAQAHELGKIQVHAEMRKDGTYRIDLVVDEEHLTPQDAGGPAGETRYGAIQGLDGDLDRRNGRFLRSLVDGATVAFDGRPVEPKSTEVALVPPSPETPGGRMTVRLSGPIPGGARAFTWTESEPVGSYPLIPANEGDEGAVWQWLEGSATSQPVQLAAEVVPPTRLEIVRQYLVLGFTHILPKGLDHILFVLGLFLLSRRARPLLLQVTAFTVAHTLTLALSIYGVISLPASIVEPLIALSIVYVAVENLLTTKLRTSRLV
ncbi:MAG: HupE/UreJ family protein, partial [Acidobacteriota bacterium]